jgi:hypothetical protein
MDEINGEQPPEEVVVTITYTLATGNINVNGPLPNRMLCYAIVKLAEKALDEFYAKNMKPKLVTPGNVAGPLGGFRR